MIKHVIIMAGGAGTRLWPASVKESPKQFMPLDGETSLLRKTIDRSESLNYPGFLVIVTHFSQKELCITEISRLSKERRKKTIILCEPQARNTAPALSLAAFLLKQMGKESDPVLVLAADHLIEPIPAFVESVNKAARLANQGNLVPFGIPPLRPDTGYGYIEAGNEEGDGFQVLSFKEKPDAVTAASFIQAGRFYWNSGMFAYRTETFLSELLVHSPELYNQFQKIALSIYRFNRIKGIRILKQISSLRTLYSEITSISVDYAIMEKSSCRKMVKAMFSWNDIGSWDVLAELDFERGKKVEANASGNFVYSDIPVGLCGVEDLIVVIKNGQALVCKKGHSQSVKTITEKMNAME